MKYKVENRSGLYVNGVAYPSGLWSGGGYTIEYVDPVVNITRFPYDEIDTVIYDDSNTFIHFNALTDTSTDSNVLVATAYDGIGVADDVTGTDLVGLSNISAEFEFSNISDAPSTADTLVTNSPIQDGDNLVIVKDDDSIHEMVASGVTPSPPYTPPPNLSFQLGSLTHWSPSSSRYAVYQTSGGGRLYINSATPNGTVTCDYNNISVIVGVRYKFSCTYSANHAGSHYAHFYRPQIIDANGTALTAYWHRTTRFGATNYEEEFVATTDTIRIDVAIRKMYGYYSNFNIERLDDLASMDTSAVTQGEIPSRVYAVDAKTSFAISGYFLEPDGAKNPSTIDAIPNMTSATAPYGVVTSKNNGHTSYPEWKSANGNASGGLNRWLGSVAGGNWWGYEFVNPIVINKYILDILSGDTTYACKDWTFLGSNTGAFTGEEVILDTQVGQSNWNGARVFAFTNGAAYKYYRIDITANNGATNFYLIGEVAFVEATLAHDYIDAVTLSDDYNYISNSLFTTRNYENLIDSLSSTTINPKVTLKSIGDKMNRMKFTTLKENT